MPMKVRYNVIDGEVFSETRGGSRKVYIPDALGNTVALMDSTGALTDTFEYFPSGTVASRTGTTPTPFQWVGGSGYYRDNSKRTHVRARNFYVNLGRWAESDPIGFRGGDYNLYRYVKNRFVVAIDPSGLYDPCKDGSCDGPGRGGTGKSRPRKNKNICGPKIHRPLNVALRAAERHYRDSRWTRRFDACAAMITPFVNLNAWDIVELHGNQGALQKYQEANVCMSGYDDCSDITVEVSGQCFYAGSVNYALFGVIAKECCSDFGSWISGLSCLDSALYLIYLYKGRGKNLGNFATSVAWTIAGFNEWPLYPTPLGDRPSCKPTCPYHYEEDFHVHWVGLNPPDFTL